MVRGILRNPDRTLIPGIFVKMRLPMGRNAEVALLVPVRAVQEDQGGRYLLVVGPRRCRRASAMCSLARRFGDLAVVTSGLDGRRPHRRRRTLAGHPGTKVHSESSRRAIRRSTEQRRPRR